MPVTTPGRSVPSGYITTPALIKPEFRELWTDFAWYIPTDGQPVDGHYISAIAPDPYQWDFIWDMSGTIDLVDTPFGKGWDFSAPDNGDFLQLGFGGRVNHPDNRLSGSNPHTFAMLFMWDGTTGDQRTLLGTSDGLGHLRLRLDDAASPTTILQRTIAFDCDVTEDVWYMLVYRPFVDLGDISDMDILLVNMEDGSIQHDRQTMSSGDVLTQYALDDDPYLFGLPAGDDPATGVSCAGVWKWDRRLGGEDAEDESWLWSDLGAFLRDPWGMFRLDPIHFLSTVALQKLRPASDVATAGWTAVPSGAFWPVLDDTPDDDATYIHPS